MVNDLSYTWKKLKNVANEVTEKLRATQGGFRKGLMRSVRMFAIDVVQFRNDFEANGPMVPGIAPAEANERLRKFQRLYEQREHKYVGYAAGEALSSACRAPSCPTSSRPRRSSSCSTGSTRSTPTSSPRSPSTTRRCGTTCRATWT